MHDDLLTRAVETVVPRELAEKKLKSGKPLRLYLGIDPTGAKLHIGHSVPLRKLKAFQEAGHEVIFLIGSFTAMIGDPAGRNTAREPLTKEQVENNFQTYKKQAAKILDFSRVQLRFNHEWLEKMQFAEIMSLASHFTVQQMLQREMFKERMSWKVCCLHCNEQFNSPIEFRSVEDMESTTLAGNTMKCPHCGKTTSLTKENLFPPPNPVTPNEFLYPLMQGYDSVKLDVDCEIGGNDQLFNMLCGRKLQKAFGKREKFVLTTRLIEGTDGRKMSKTYNNCVYLEDEPSDMFGKVMSVKDDLMATYFECCTDVDMGEVKKILKGSPRDAKARLAREIVSLYHGTDAASKGEEAFNRVFKDKGLPEDIPEVKVKKGTALIEVLVSSKLAPSKSEARRLIEQGGVKLNTHVVQSEEHGIEEGVLQVGKRKFVRLRLA